MYSLDITDDFYSFFSMECGETTFPFISLQNQIKSNTLSLSVENLIANLSDPIIYNYIEKHKPNGVISDAIKNLDLSHKFKDLEVMLLNSTFVFSKINGISYILNNQNKTHIYEIGNTDKNQEIKIIEGKSLDFYNTDLTIKIYLSNDSKIEVFFRETDILISSINFNHLLENKIELIQTSKEEIIKLKNIAFTENNIANLINHELFQLNFCDLGLVGGV